MNIEVSLLELRLSLGICPGVGLLNRIVVLYLVFLYHFTFLATVEKMSLFFTLSPAFISCRLTVNGHSDLCEVISCYIVGLICISLIISDVEHVFI